MLGARPDGQLAVGELAELPADELAGGCVPDPGRAIPAGGEQAGAIRTPPTSSHWAGVAGESELGLTGGCVPNPGRVVVAGAPSTC
jgi:hypothetical protein